MTWHSPAVSDSSPVNRVLRADWSAQPNLTPKKLASGKFREAAPQTTPRDAFSHLSVVAGAVQFSFIPWV